MVIRLGLPMGLRMALPRVTPSVLLTVCPLAKLLALQ